MPVPGVFVSGAARQGSHLHQPERPGQPAVQVFPRDAGERVAETVQTVGIHVGHQAALGDGPVRRLHTSTALTTLLLAWRRHSSSDPSTVPLVLIPKHWNQNGDHHGLY